MKKTKRLLSLLLILCMIIPSITVSGEFKDVPDGVEYYDAVNLLSALKIVQGYPDGTFAPNNDVTRAEFTTLLIRAMNLEKLAQASSLANFPFTDCTSEGIAYALPNIKLAYERGIILGMGENLFAPEANVTYEQAVKMVVCAAGYEYIAIEKGGWPNGYMIAGQDIRLLDGVNGQMGVAAKRWQIAQLLYNAFNVELMTKAITGDSQAPVYTVNPNKTWLSDYLSLKRDSGTVVADSITSIANSGLTARAGESVIKLDSNNQETLFDMGEWSIDGLIGKPVNIYYEIENSTQKKIIKFIEDKTRKNSSITINVEDLVDIQNMDPFNGGRVEYWENSQTDLEKRVYLTVAQNPTMVLNGKLYTPSDRASFRTEMESLITGQIEFIDSNFNGSYDKLFITKIETYVVSKNTLDAVTNTGRILTDMYRTPAQNNTYTIDENSNTSVVNITNQNGTKITASSIGMWNVVEVKESKNDAGRNLINITVVTNTVSGTVTEVSSEGDIIISNKKYKLSSYYKKYGVGNNSDNELSLGQTGTFYLDSMGNIAAADKKDETASYGYIYKMGMMDGEMNSDELVIQMRRSNGTLAQYSVTTRIAYDGESKTPSDGFKYLKESALMTNYDTATADIDALKGSQLIKYTLDANGRLKSVITVKKPSATDEVNTSSLTRTDLAYVVNANGKREPIKFNYETTNSGHFMHANGSRKIEVNSNTLVYLVSPDREDTKIRIGSVKNNLEKNGNYIVEVFDVESSLAKVLIIYTDDTIEKISALTPLSIIANMKIASNTSIGASSTVFDAFLVSSSYTGLKKNIFTDSTSTLDGIKPGDVIKTATDENGNVRSGDGVVKVWDVNASEAPSTDGNEWVNTEPKLKNSYYYQTIVGYVKSVSSDKTRITVIPTTDKTKLDEVEPITYDISNVKGYLIFNRNLDNPVMPRYEEGQTPTALTFDDIYTVIKPYDTNPDDPTEVLIHLYGGTETSLRPQLVYAIQR